VFQLTGVKFPDSELHNASEVRFLLYKLVKRPKPAKLVDVLELNSKLQGLRNVSISPTRITLADKEHKLGRQKLIEKELEKRGLPVYISGDLKGKLQHHGYRNRRHY
jgi:hypothetical protein